MNDEFTDVLCLGTVWRLCKCYDERR